MTQVDGVPVAADSIVVKYTWMGDMDLDGKVTVNDYAEFLHYLTDPPPAADISWMTGDFNGDGKINVNDYVLLLGGLAAQNSVLSDDDATAAAVTVETPAPVSAADTLVNLLAKAGGTLALPAPASGARLPRPTQAPRTWPSARRPTRMAHPRHRSWPSRRRRRARMCCGFSAV